MLAVVFPEVGGFGLQRVHHHQELELGQTGTHTGFVRQRGQRVEALGDVAVDLAVLHHVEVLQHVVLAVELGQVVVGPVVFHRGRRSPPGLHQADVELGVVLPVAHLARAQWHLRARLDELSVVLLLLAGQGQVARQAGRQDAQVGQALDVRVTTQRVHAAAGQANVAQQQLHHGASANDLRAGRVLGPAQCIQDGGHAAGLRRAGQLLAHMQEFLLGCAAGAFHLLGRVLGIVLFQPLVNAARVLQRRVGHYKPVFAHLVVPRRLVIGALFRVIARENAFFKRKVLAHDEREVGVVPNVLVVDLVVGQQVVDDPAEKDDVAAGTDGRVKVGHRCRAVKARIDHHEVSLVVLLRFDDPLEPAGVCFSGIAAHDQNNVRILDVDPMVRHRSTAKRRGKTCHRRAVSDTCLVIECEKAPAAGNLVGDVTGFVAGG